VRQGSSLSGAASRNARGARGSRSQPGSGKRVGSRLARTPSVSVRDFIGPDPRAHGHMTDRQDHEAGSRPNNRTHGVLFVKRAC